MGSPADWGALGDICGEDEAGGRSAHQLRGEITAALHQRMVGQTVRVRVQQATSQSTAHLLDRLLLENVETGDKLALGLGRLGRRMVIRLTEGETGSAAAEADCEGRLVAVTSRCDEPGGAGRICLHLQSRELFGPFVNRMPCLRRSLHRALPPLAADEILTCLDGAWEAPPAREVLVSADEENTVGEGAWPSMSWWPAMPDDWALVDA